jgi:hypothetical protein
MKKMLSISLSLVMGILFLASSAFTQDDPAKRPSPMSMSRIMLGDTYIRVVYSRPYKKGRANIFGAKESEALVPFGEVWRTGANEATEVTVTRDVMVGDKKLPAGTYSLFTVPGLDKWTVHFNKALGLSGTARYNMETKKYEEGYVPANDVAVVTAAVKKLDAEVDPFTIAFEKVDGGAHMILKWITTEVRVPIKVK